LWQCLQPIREQYLLRAMNKSPGGRRQLEKARQVKDHFDADVVADIVPSPAPSWFGGGLLSRLVDATPAASGKQRPILWFLRFTRAAISTRALG
jgi:hypothetical protein